MIYTCGIALFDKDNKLLAAHPTGMLPSIWSIPKGLFDANIDSCYAEAAIRECYEETGIIIYEPIEFIGKYKYPGRSKTLVGFFYKINETIDTDKIKCNSFTSKGIPEIDTFKWMTIKDFLAVCHPTQRFLINDITKKGYV